VHLLRQDGHLEVLGDGELDARGNDLHVGNLKQLLQACPRGSGGQPALRSLRLDGAWVQGDATLMAADIDGPFSAAGARFQGDLDARDVTVGGTSVLRRLQVAGRLDLRDLRATGAVDASQLQVTDLEATTARFEADLSLAEAQLAGRCDFRRLQVIGTLRLTNARFGGECAWGDMTVEQHLMGGVCASMGGPT
jgi:hypothetical protein